VSGKCYVLTPSQYQAALLDKNINKKHLYFSRCAFNHTTETFKPKTEFRIAHRAITYSDGVDVEKVIAVAKKPNGGMAFVKWKGHAEQHNSWIDLEDVPEEKRIDKTDFKLPLTLQIVKTNPNASQHRYATRRRPRGSDHLRWWDISNVAVITTAESFIPFEHSDKIDVPTWRVLTDIEQTTVVPAKDEPEESDDDEEEEEENTDDEYYERLHAEQNVRIQEMIQRATLQKKNQERRSGGGGNTTDDDDEDENDDNDDIETS